jgi:hypothetical protein
VRSFLLSMFAITLTIGFIVYLVGAIVFVVSGIKHLYEWWDR